MRLELTGTWMNGRNCARSNAAWEWTHQRLRGMNRTDDVRNNLEDVVDGEIGDEILLERLVSVSEARRFAVGLAGSGGSIAAGPGNLRHRDGRRLGGEREKEER